MLEKRRDLMRQGLSLSNLLITVVRKPDGEGHAVLTVRTDKGDFVLDNLTDSVRQWDQTGYRFLKRQASNHTGRWVTIREASLQRRWSARSSSSLALPSSWRVLVPSVTICAATRVLCWPIGDRLRRRQSRHARFTPPAPCARR